MRSRWPKFKKAKTLGILQRRTNSFQFLDHANQRNMSRRRNVDRDILSQLSSDEPLDLDDQTAFISKLSVDNHNQYLLNVKYINYFLYLQLLPVSIYQLLGRLNRLGTSIGFYSTFFLAYLKLNHPNTTVSYTKNIPFGEWGLLVAVVIEALVVGMWHRNYWILCLGLVDLWLCWSVHYSYQGMVNLIDDLDKLKYKYKSV